MLHLKVLGGVAVDGPRGPLTGRAVQRRRLALLAILASGQARGRGASRERVAAYLWPEADAERGRRLLSDSVYRINQAVGDEAIVAVGDELRLSDALVSTDVAEFERAVDAGYRERAVALYAGPLLDGVYLVDGSEFERWADGERARLGRLYQDVLDALAQTSESNGNAGAAVGWWRRLSSLDPYSSRVALRYMQALAAAGDSGAAVRHAAAHTALLQEELGVAPNAAVLRFADRLKADPVEPLLEPVVWRGLQRVPTAPSVSKSGSRIRITVQLSNDDDGLQLWSQSYDRDLDDVFAIQEDISRSIENMLRRPLAPARPAVNSDVQRPRLEVIRGLRDSSGG